MQRIPLLIALAGPLQQPRHLSLQVGEEVGKPHLRHRTWVAKFQRRARRQRREREVRRRAQLATALRHSEKNRLQRWPAKRRARQRSFCFRDRERLLGVCYGLRFKKWSRARSYTPAPPTASHCAASNAHTPSWCASSSERWVARLLRITES